MSEFEETMSVGAMFRTGGNPTEKSQFTDNSKETQETEHKSAGRPLKSIWSPVELYVSDEGDEVGYYVKIEYTDTQLITGRVVTTFLSVCKDTGEFGQVVRKGRVGEWVPMKGEPYNPRRPYFVFTSKSCPLLIYRIRLDNEGNVVEEHLWYAEIGKQLGEHGFLVYVKPRVEVGNEDLVGRVRGVVLGGGRERLVTGASSKESSAATEEASAAAEEESATTEEESAATEEESATTEEESATSVDAVMAELNQLVGEDPEEPKSFSGEPEEGNTSETTMDANMGTDATNAPTPGISDVETPATFKVPEL